MHVPSAIDRRHYAVLAEALGMSVIDLQAQGAADDRARAPIPRAVAQPLVDPPWRHAQREDAQERRWAQHLVKGVRLGRPPRERPPLSGQWGTRHRGRATAA